MRVGRADVRAYRAAKARHELGEPADRLIRQHGLQVVILKELPACHSRKFCLCARGRNKKTLAILTRFKPKTGRVIPRSRRFLIPLP